ncbi:MAG: FHA domain-containing protein [Acidobacteria bacterium]|nr:FHA domain-containing protein [Acidobacteriota bacterium]
MKPQLVAIAGPLKDAAFLLADVDFSIGRDSSNDLAIADLALSRKHCVIKPASDGFSLQDLGSLNGSLVNGTPVRERRLNHGDRIGLGDSVFLVLLEEAPALPAGVSVEWDESSSVTRSTVQLRIDDALYTGRPADAPLMDRGLRSLRDLETLLGISTTLHAIRSVQELQEQVLEAAIRTVPADQGAILLLDALGVEFTSVVGRRSNGSAVRVRSRSISG